MAVIQWLHFSDLHFNKTGVETVRLRRRLIPYLKSLNIHCKYAFCTGDVRYAPAGGFPADSGEQIREICGSVGVPVSRIFIVPGNHDVNRYFPGRDEAVRRVWFRHHGTYQPLEGTIDPEDGKLLMGGEKEYTEFLRSLYRNEAPERAEFYANPEAPHFVIETEDFNIIHMDSTLTCTTDQEKDLIIGTASLMKALDHINTDKASVLLTHYSFDFLERDEQKEVAGLLRDANVQLWLAGHEHDHLARRQWDSFYEIQCGNLVLENGATACVMVGRYDTETGEGQVQVHAWFPREGWAPYPFARLSGTEGEDRSVYPFSVGLRAKSERGGKCGARKEAENAAIECERMQNPGGMFYGIEFKKELLPDLRSAGTYYSGENDTGKTGCPLLRALENLWTGQAENGKNGKTCHALLLGEGGTGKSTALYQSCLALNESGRGPALFLSLQMLESRKEGIEEAVVRCLFEATDAGARDRLYRLTKERRERPDLILMLDGFNELGGENAGSFMTEIKKLSGRPGIQLVISSRSDFLREYGMSHFEMLTVCELREDQIDTLFSPEWREKIREDSSLTLLLKNPMMVLLYAQTCPILDRHPADGFLRWAQPVETEADLLRNYYSAQTAGLLERYQVSGRKVSSGALIVEFLLPELGAAAQREGRIGWEEEEFEEVFHRIWTGCIEMGRVPEVNKKLKRAIRMRGEEPEEEEVYDLLLYEMCLLYHGNGKIVFRHQIFRDYMAAVYFHSLLSECLKSELIPREWETRAIGEPVLSFLRCMDADVWVPGGIADRILTLYREKNLQTEAQGGKTQEIETSGKVTRETETQGTEAQEKETPGTEGAGNGKFGLVNSLNCWLPREWEKRTIRRLSGLDLRKVPLSAHLKRHYEGSISIDGSRVTRETFVNGLRHDRILSMGFSADGRFLAAVSENGLVSVINIRSQLQLQAGAVRLPGVQESGGRAVSVRLFYNASGCLELHSGGRAWTWPDVDYKRVAEIPETQESELGETAVRADAAGNFIRLLAENDLAGEVQEISPDRTLAAVGSAGGQIQLWDVKERTCTAELSLGDASLAAVSFSADGSLAAAGAGGRLVQIWDIEGERCIRTLHFEKPVRKLRFMKETNRLVECVFSDQSYADIEWKTGRQVKSGRERKHPLNRSMIQKELAQKEIAKVETSASGNAVIMEKNSRVAWVWDNKNKTMNPCPGHMSKVQDIAICHADDRFAATCSDERIRPEKGMRKELRDQKVVRVRIVKTGRCQWRLPTNGRTIRKLKFYTSNRIVLAGFATNGDIMLWELHNQLWYNGTREVGHWETIDIVRKSKEEPLECVVPEERRIFIGAYPDGTILKRTFDGSLESQFRIFPGIDLSAVEWTELETEDGELSRTLARYKDSGGTQKKAEE